MIKVIENDDCNFCGNFSTILICWLKFSEYAFICPKCWSKEIIRPMLESSRQDVFSINLFDKSQTSFDEPVEAVTLKREDLVQFKKILDKYLN